jgi:hypothetical protein
MTSPKSIRTLFAVLLLASVVKAADGTPTATAQYTVKFDATWTATTHPVSYPAGAHFSGLIGGTHDSGVTFWEAGGVASPGIESMAEVGAKTLLTNEVNAAIGAGTAGEVISGAALFTVPGSVQTSFTVSTDHPLATVVTMIAPSPDWFLGVNGLDLLASGDWTDEIVVELLPWDAGTDSGTTYNSPNQDTNPQDPIALITTPPVGNGVPLGTFTFTRTDTPPAWQDLGGALAGTFGTPNLVGSGAPVPGGSVTLTLSDAPPLTPTFLVVGFSVVNAPLKGGTLVPSLDLLLNLPATNGAGGLALPGTLPAALPSGATLVFQCWLQDAGGPVGFVASQGVCATVQ